MEYKSVSLSREQLDELIDLLDSYVGREESRDGFVYGNYMEFPSASSLDEETLDAVLGILAQDGSVLTLGDKVSLVASLLPDTIYEQDLPDEYKFWNSAVFGADEFDFPPSPVDKLVAEIEEIQEAFLRADDHLVKKGLAVAAFALLEAHGKAVFKNNPVEISGDPGLAEYVNSKIKRESDNLESWRDILRALGRDEAPGKVAGYDLRNALSHDFASVEVKRDLFYFKATSGNPATRKVSEYFDGLRNYAEKYLNFSDRSSGKVQPP